MTAVRSPNAPLILHPSAELARFASELKYSDIPEPVLRRCEDLLLDTLASILAGSTARAVKAEGKQRGVRVIAVSHRVSEWRELEEFAGARPEPGPIVIQVKAQPLKVAEAPPPPPPSSVSFAALTMASTSCSVMSPLTNSILAMACSYGMAVPL